MFYIPLPATLGEEPGTDIILVGDWTIGPIRVVRETADHEHPEPRRLAMMELAEGFRGPSDHVAMIVVENGDAKLGLHVSLTPKITVPL